MLFRSYSFRGVDVEDFARGESSDGKSALRRTMKFRGSLPDGLHLRLAEGKIVPNGKDTWRLDDALTIRARDASAFVRGEGEHRELLVPLMRNSKSAELEVEYVW